MEFFSDMVQKTKLQEILKLHGDFSARFCGHVLQLLMENSDSKENIALSTARLQAVLVLIANWTTPEIRKQILSMAVGENITLDEANLLFDFANVKPIPDENVIVWDDDGNPVSLTPTLEQQTTLWYKNGLTFNENAIEKMKSAFNACARAVNFADPKTKDIIDKTVRKATHDLIPHLDANIDALTRSLIVDILYFKGSWRDQFYEENTAERIFYGTQGKKKVPTMHRQGRMDYKETPVYQAVNLLYTCVSANHKQFAMRIYLPVGEHTISDVLEEMRKAEYKFSSKFEEVDLSLPRFEVTSRLDLTALLKSMGMSCLFESENIIPECIEGSQMADIVQQVKVKVDENGTEAAAVTCCSVGCLWYEKPHPKVMKVNKPFLFEIVEETTNTVLFSGVINNIE